jgi:PAS domain S-box-containing protein
MRALKIVNALGLDIPFILVSGSIGEDLAVAVMQLGAADYLLKDRLARLGPAVTRALEQKRLRDEKRRADQALRLSEERFRRYFELGLIGMAITSPVKGWLEVNDELCAILGYERSELLQKTWTELTHPDDLAADVAQFNRVIAGESDGYSIDKRWLRKDGQIIDTTISVKCLRRTDGSVDYFVALLQDITERKRAEEALRQSEERFRALIEHSSDAIALADADGRILYASPAATHILGLTSDQLVGKSTLSGIHPDDVEGAKKTFFDLVSRPGESVPGQFRLRHRTGSWRWVEGIGTNLLHVPSVHAMLANYRDITERKVRERELEAIATVSAALRAAVTRAEMLPIVLDQVSALLEIDGAALMMRDEMTSEVFMELGYGTAEDLISRRIPAGVGIVGQVFKTGLTYLTNDARHDPLLMWPQRLGAMTAVACVPLITHEQTIGALWVGRQTPIVESEVRLLGAIADIAANAIHRATLFEAERDQRTLAESLRDSAAALSSTLNFDEVLDRILVNAGRVVAHDTISLMLIDAESGVAHIVRQLGFEKYQAEDVARSAQFMLDAVPNLRRMANMGQPLVISDTRQDADWVTFPELSWVRSYTGFPLRVKGRVVGILEFYSSTSGFFTSVHTDRMQAFADQAAIAIENARLYQEIRRYAEELETRVADRTRELTEANTQLAAANQRLQELDQLKSKFVSDVSHELRTPVTSLKLYTELLDHGKPEKQAGYKQSLIEQANRLMQLVEDILNLSRLELGASRIQFEPVDLNTLVAAVVGAHQPGAEAAGLKLSFTPDAHLPPVQGEPNQLAQVMTNLITNAINYTPQGMVQVRTFRRGQRICLEVQDSGLGIDPEDVPHLFDRFYRGTRAVKSKIRGTGLGLAIVKEIVDLHGGQIEVESKVNAGTTFRVCLAPADVGASQTG